MNITQMLLDQSQYIPTTSKKTQIVVHGTAGSCRPDYVVQGWAADPQRVGTTYVIGGMSSTGDKAWDGKIIQAIPMSCSIYHLGVKGAVNANNILDKSSVGIELCNWSYLVKSPKGEFLNYVNKPVPASQVCELAEPYRGYKYYHAITDAQIASLRDLILSICATQKIALAPKRYEAVDFEYNPTRAATQQITFHSAYRNDKWDVCMYPNLVAMLNSLSPA